MSWIRLQQNWMSRVEWYNIICHEQTSNIFCNHFRVSATDIIHQVSSVTLNVSTSVTLQTNTLQSIEPFTIHGSVSHICSHSLEWIQMSVIHCNIGSVNPPFHLCGGLEAPLFLSTMFVCMYVGLFTCLSCFQLQFQYLKIVEILINQIN